MTTTTLSALRDGTWTVQAHDAIASFTVRELGLLRVRGGFTVTGGSVTVRDGRPVAAAATLDARSVRTGMARRDADLLGKHFLHTAAHPRIQVHCTEVTPGGDGWTAAAVLTVAGGEAPLDLQVSSRPGSAPDSVRIKITGVLDRARTPIRAPRWLVGRWIAIEVHATLGQPY